MMWHHRCLWPSAFPCDEITGAQYLQMIRITNMKTNFFADCPRETHIGLLVSTPCPWEFGHPVAAVSHVQDSNMIIELAAIRDKIKARDAGFTRGCLLQYKWTSRSQLTRSSRFPTAWRPQPVGRGNTYQSVDAFEHAFGSVMRACTPEPAYLKELRTWGTVNIDGLVSSGQGSPSACPWMRSALANERRVGWVGRPRGCARGCPGRMSWRVRLIFGLTRC